MEPISRPPRQKPTSHPLIYYPAAIFFISSITFTCIALISLQVASVVILASQYPLLLFVPRNSHLKMRVWFYQQYKSVIRLTEKSFGLQLALVCWVLLPKQKLVLTGDYKSLDSVEKAILIANHQIYLDWFYIWLLAVRFERHGDLKIMLIAIMKHVPLFGLGMQFFEFIFMKQKLALDQQNILNHMDHLRDYCQGFPLWLLIFPEGTLNTPKNRKSSREYAKKNDIKEEPKYVLLPKATGLFMCSRALLDQVDTIFDLTIGYSGLEKEDIPYDEYLIENVYFAKHYPETVHIHVQKRQLQELPGMDLDGVVHNVFDESYIKKRDLFNTWLKQDFMEKDLMMESFYESGKFAEPGEVWSIKFRSTDWIVIVIVWSSSLLTIPIHYNLIKFVIVTLWGFLL